MISHECILTQSNAALLQKLFEAQPQKNTLFAKLLKSKLDNAQIRPEYDIPDNIVTLDSRVTYSVNAAFTDTRIISARNSSNIVGLSLPVTNLRALALIGLRQGQYFTLVQPDHSTDRIYVEKVQFQPETHRQFLKDAVNANSPAQRRASIKLVHSAAGHPAFFSQTSR
jgi:regulator of nucleoside diphosphate kinase